MKIYVFYFIALLVSALMISACTDAVAPLEEQNDGEALTEDAAAKKLALQFSDPGWELIFSDEFTNDGNFDSSKWSFSPRSNTGWGKFITQTPAYAHQTGGNLILRMDNAVIPGDSVPYHTGAVQTATKFNFTYGRVEVRAKFNQGQGSWPAIWALPEIDTYGGWPKSGELDIMEHINNENIVHQTVHNGWVTDTLTCWCSSATTNGPYNTADFNTYSMVWTTTSIQYYVNDQLRYTYTRPTAASAMQWPFDKPFFLILNQSGGAGWSGPANDAHLPFQMEVDYVRVYKQPELESGATYQIFSAVNNTSVLDVNGGETGNGTAVILWANASSTNQRWKVEKTGEGLYKLHPSHALNKALDVSGAGTSDGTKVQIWDDNGTAAQRWYINYDGNDYYVMAPANATAKQLDVQGGSSANGARLQIYSPNTTNAQKFRFVKQ